MATAVRAVRRNDAAVASLTQAGYSSLALISQVALLWTISADSSFVVSSLHLTIPGNVLGMVVLFAALSTGAIKLDWLERGGSLLTRHLAFFFVPITVGLIGFGSVLAHYGFAIALTLGVSAVAGLLASAYTTQALARRADN